MRGLLLRAVCALLLYLQPIVGAAAALGAETPPTPAAAAEPELPVQVEATVSAANQRIDGTGNRFKIFQYGEPPRGFYAPALSAEVQAPGQFLKVQAWDVSEPSGRGRLRWFDRGVMSLTVERNHNQFFLYPELLDRHSVHDSRGEWNARMALRLGDFAPIATYRRLTEHVERPVHQDIALFIGHPVGIRDIDYQNQEVGVALPFRLANARFEASAYWSDFGDGLRGTPLSRPAVGDLRTRSYTMRGTWEVTPTTSFGGQFTNQQSIRDVAGIHLNRNLARIDVLHRFSPRVRLRGLVELDHNDNDFTRTFHYTQRDRAQLEVGWQVTRQVRLEVGGERLRALVQRPTAAALNKYPLTDSGNPSDPTSPLLVPIAPGDLITDRIYLNRLWLGVQYKPLPGLAVSYRLRETRLPLVPFTEILTERGFPPTGVMLGLYSNRIRSQDARISFQALPTLNFQGTFHNEFRQNTARSVFQDSNWLTLGISNELTPRFSWHFDTMLLGFNSSNFSELSSRSARSAGFDGGLDYRVADRVWISYDVAQTSTLARQVPLASTGTSPALERSQRLGLRWEPYPRDALQLWYETRHFDESLARLLNYRTSTVGASWSHHF